MGKRTALGFAIRRLRQGLNLTQEDVGRRANINPTYVSQLETGARVAPSWPILLRIAAALEVQPTDLTAMAGMGDESSSGPGGPLVRVPVRPELAPAIREIAEEPLDLIQAIVHYLRAVKRYYRPPEGNGQEPS